MWLTVALAEGIKAELQWVASGCWIWPGPFHGPYRYPVARPSRNRAVFIQRAVWAELIGELSRKDLLKVTCGLIACCNPAHMKRVSGSREGTELSKPPRTHWFETNERGCWIWTGKTTPAGYGTCMIAGKRVFTHRRSYELASGIAVPRGLKILHSCDNPPCCNPAHLGLGTQQQNSEDMASKFRAPSRKLTAEQIETIRQRRRDSNEPLRKLAKEFGVTHKTIQKVIRRWGYGGRRQPRVAESLSVPTTPCWIWEGTPEHTGYGRVKVNGRNCLVHKRAWEVTYGKVPSGLVVRHLCDVRACIRPDHLIVGTYQQNSDDSNGRLRGNHKITFDQADEIRKLRATGISFAKLGVAFNLDSTSIMRLCRNEIYVRPTSSTKPKGALLVQLDGKLPNIALMRIAAHCRAQGIAVTLRRWTKSDQIQRELGFEPAYVYASAIFDRSRPLVDKLRAQFPAAIVGGTGVAITETLESHGIRTLDQDYSIYPAYHASIGFSQRGCRLKCPFCVVPVKEGEIREEQSITALWRGDPWPRHINLLDNDFFGQPNWRERIAEIRHGGFRVSFSQGINARMIDDETAEAIASIDYYDDGFTRRRIYTAWDNRKDEARLFRGLNALVRYGVKPDQIMVYMLCGYWPGETHDDREYRRQRLRDFGCRPYPMPYERTPALVGFQRWVIGAYDKRVPWQDWVAANYQPRQLAIEDELAVLL